MVLICKEDVKYRQICWWTERIFVGLGGAIGRKIEILLEISCLQRREEGTLQMRLEH
jgi:hypothetical protein